MTFRIKLALVVLAMALGHGEVLKAGWWPQFRGPGSAAAPESDAKLPAAIGPDQGVLWKIDLAPGHSSPVIARGRLFLTTAGEKRLFTVAIDCDTGKILWEREAPADKLEKIHQVGSHAQPTSVTDGTRVVSFFGSTGLFCYDFEGKLLWQVRMGPFKSEFGAASSPIISGDRVILNVDVDADSFLAAFDKNTGKEIWRSDRSEFPVGCATPIIWEVDGKKQIVVAGTLRIVGYDFDTGKEVWTVRGMARVCNTTPAIGADKTLFVCGWAAAADPGERLTVPTFDEMIDMHDKNKNGTLEVEELPEGPFKQRFGLIDRDKDGHITRQEWNGMKKIFEAAENRLVAIRPGGTGEITDSHVLWSQDRNLPFVASPLYHKGLLYLVKDNGILTVLDAGTGKPTRSDRLQAAGNYYASPVAGDGKVFVCSQKGALIVVSAEKDWKTLHKADFEEEIFATPAIVDGRIYLRTTGHLYCFGTK
jgi:outer membrane protein assembly factor BamB